MTDENEPKNPPEGEGGDPAPDIADDPDIAALEAAVKEKELAQAAFTVEKLALADAKIAELTTTNATLEARLLALEKDTRVKDLQKKLDIMASTPVAHTVVSGGAGGLAAPQAIELDSGEFAAFSATDFSED